ncbi:MULTISPECIES: hypothetical protein [Pseudomonas]|uniref:hypothetical protein n=1 Tax=Pseudomonas TaxID=286 RepID=UPI0013A7882B|nr:hypothetical protein [Pseudomonas sp. OIL-1]QIB51520.1 hypothetical protein G3M63_10950 [Pseudomonas sp. OIL-1]
MIFTTHASWLINSFFEKGVLPLGERFYAMVELGLNIPIYIVEILYDVEEGEANWQRFLVSQFDDALRLVEPGVASHAISILLPRQASASYDMELGFIERVEEGKTEDGRVSRLFTCSGGKRYMDPGHTFQGTDEEAASLTRRTTYLNTKPKPVTVVDDDAE